MKVHNFFLSSLLFTVLWFSQDGNFTKAEDKTKTGVKHVGQSSFIDFGEYCGRKTGRLWEQSKSKILKPSKINVHIQVAWKPLILVASAQVQTVSNPTWLGMCVYAWQINFSPQSFKLSLHLKLCSFKVLQIGLVSLALAVSLQPSHHTTFLPYTHRIYKCSPLPRQTNLTHSPAVIHSQSCTVLDLCEHLIPLNNLGL